MRTKIQKNRVLTYLVTFFFVLSFLALSPSDNARAAVNLASGKLPTSSVAFTNLSRVTDGSRTTSSYADSYTNSGVNWVQINLGASYNVNNIKLWHYYGDSRKYHDVVVQLSATSDFSSPVTVYNNDTDGSAGRGTGSDSEYTETSAGLNIAFNGVNAQYVRFYSNGSTANAYNHYVEIEIYQGTTQITGNLASAKTPTSSAAFTGLSRVTDNIVDTNSYADSYTNSGIQWIQIDLGASYNVNNIKLWHYFGDSRKYHDVIVQLSNSSDFSSSVTTVYNNDTNNSANRGTGSDSEYTETSSGLDLEFGATNARYARFYSNGSTANTYNHYVEIEIYAAAAVVHPTSVSLNKTAATLAAGGTETLTATVLPAEAANKNVTWSTSAAGIATVSQTGVVTGVAAGAATITVTTSDGGLTDTCTVNVEVVHPASVTLNKTTDTIAVGATDTLTATVLPANAANKNVAWSTSAAGVATVSQAGVVTGVAPGTAIITATTVDGGKIATCTVTVTATASNIISGKLPTSSIAFTSLARVTDGDKNTNNYADSYTNSGLQWIQFDLGANYNISSIKLWHYYGDTRKYHDVVVQLSNDPTFASGATTVYNNDTNNSAGRGTGTSSEYSETSAGLSIAVSNTSARYARFYSNGSSANVYNHYVEAEIYGIPAEVVHPASLELNKTAATIGLGSTDTLTATVLPANATNKSVTWSSSAAGIATVSPAGVVTGVAAGTATITATTVDGGITAACAVTVEAIHPASVTLNKSTASLIEAKITTLTATVLPANASDKSVAWSTSDSNVATVSAKGVVTGINPGTANITATTNDGKLPASCAVTVSSGKLTDYKAVYEKDNDNVENLYVTIVTDNTVTFDEVNDWNVDSLESKPEINVRFDYGTPASDTTGVTANAVLSQRGKLSTFADLKSYKIKLSDTATKWKGQKTLNLNKHPYELSKIRNKLCFDLMKMFPDAFSLRTQFTHVYIRDLNSSNVNYVDYGLFTHVEDIGKDYLESRGIERSAYIYKAEDFEFLTYPDVIKNVTDTGYNLAEFEKILEVKGIEEHSRLIAMLKDVNDESQDINDVISKWFERDNYITWFAMNILLNNTDTNSANFFIMSPADQDKWYFIPWDYDFSLGYDYTLGFDNYNWSSPYILNGASMYWGATLHRRFLQDPQNIADLSAKIEELSAIATEEVVEAKVGSCYDATNALIKRNPDLAIMGTTVSNYENEILRLPSTLAAAKQQYYDGLDVPMPFKLNEVQESGGQYTFTWEESYDLDGDALNYDFAISSTPDFDDGDIIEEQSGLQNRSVVIDSLENGTYYWRVRVYDSAGNRMVAFGSYFDEAEHFGVRQLIIN